MIRRLTIAIDRHVARSQAGPTDQLRRCGARPEKLKQRVGSNGVGVCPDDGHCRSDGTCGPEILGEMQNV